jgi:hypothetical protein
VTCLLVNAFHAYFGSEEWFSGFRGKTRTKSPLFSSLTNELKWLELLYFLCLKLLTSFDCLSAIHVCGYQSDALTMKTNLIELIFNV